MLANLQLELLKLGPYGCNLSNLGGKVKPADLGRRLKLPEGRYVRLELCLKAFVRLLDDLAALLEVLRVKVLG